MDSSRNHARTIMRSFLRLLTPLLAIPAHAFCADSTETLSYHFQFTAIQQAHPSFNAKYTGENSLLPGKENVLSVTSTLFLGHRLWKGGEVYFNPELSAGGGFSSTTGIAGFPNGEVYRVDNPAPKVFIARLFLRQEIPLGDETEVVPPDQNQLAGPRAVSRVTLTAGRFSLTDVFDDNRYSHDARTQFLNWSLWSGAAWDYAADTRGYDWGLLAEFHRKEYIVNIAAVMVPTYANGPYFDHNIGRAFSLNFEFVPAYVIGGEEGRLHIIGFMNRAAMGSYREALDRGAAAGTSPDIEGTRSYRTKYGFVISVEQALGETVGVFGRVSWNDGKTETWMFTEIDRAFHLGLALRGEILGRRDDNAGIAYAVNAISQDHRDYLAAGG
ncbi:MAG TPA: carbohydrate porin, partial [Bacteroidota bacterium]|nr:carbohydrate porin [Bacteroidota bacterium]